MEIIDKEELLDKHGAYWVSKFDKKKSIDCKDAISAIEEVESYYLKQIEEKDKTLNHYKISVRGLNTMYEESQQQLQEAKELLKYIKQNSGAILYAFHSKKNKEIEEFLNKQD